MSNYSDSEASCRVDFWKESGKWYTTEAVKWVGNGFTHNPPLLHEQFHDSLKAHFKGKSRLVGMRATCLEPYHKHSHPISVIVKDYEQDA